MPVTLQTLRLQRGLDAQLATITDQQVRDLVAAWVDAWDEVAPDLNTALLELLVAGEQVTRSQLLRAKRLQRVLALIADRLEELAAEAGVRITSDLADIVDQAGTAQAAIIDTQTPGVSRLVDLNAWSRIEERVVTAIVERTTKQITSRTRPLSREAYQAVRRELIRGVAAGSNPRVTARRMVDRAEGHFNGGLARALTIARTETLDAHRAAAAAGQAQHADVLAGWVWNTHLDARTCPACIGMNGREFDLTEPGPLGHQNCRCARTPRTKTWAELGFGDLDEPASVMPDSESWFAGLTEAEQRKILGPARYQAWLAGDFPITAWATLRSSDGWRDSYVVAKPPSSGGRRSPKAA